ncbi:uncharacterized protein LOC124172742 isoform X2 [Ischnura elegans]|uniref:uncharacterized protein LOC124172742 isoform X2 n=1 Tax=Ischnura elegans TaxID=197161 RepID=UPI001ED886FC|nr:uncharacterized protein LOC124172742 isoform X2 [Ischnura elegans]
MGGTCFWPSSSFGTPLLLLFMLLLHLSEYCNGSTYMSYDIRSDRICNRYHKREVDVTMSQSVILDLHSSEALTSGTSLSVSCNFEVEAKGSYRRGVVMVVQKMGFRSQGDNCIDYIQRVFKPIKGFKMKHKKDKLKKKALKHAAKATIGKRDIENDSDYRGARICGNALFGLLVDHNETLPPPFANPLPPTPPREDHFISSFMVETQRINPYESVVSDAAEVDNKGELKMHLYLSNRPLRVGEEPVKLMMVYSAYQECDGRRVPEGLFHCGYGLCISGELVDDGIVNCPFGDCIDETNCTNAKNSNITAFIRHYSTTVYRGGEDAGAAAGGLVSFLVISGCIACCVYYCFKRRRDQKTTTTPAPVAEDGGVELTDPSKPPSTYYPTQPAAQPPPGGQPAGYYPMVPQQPPPGYPGQQPPAAYPGYPPPGGYPGQPQNAGYPGQPQTAGYPGPPPAAGYPGPPPNNAGGYL